MWFLLLISQRNPTCCFTFSQWPVMGILPDTQNCKLRMRRECRERFRGVSDPDMHHGACVTHVLWCMPGSLISGFFKVCGEENVPGIPGECATSNFTYLANGYGWVFLKTAVRVTCYAHQGLTMKYFETAVYPYTAHLKYCYLLEYSAFSNVLLT